MNKNILVPHSSLTDWELIDQGQFGSVYKAKHTVFKVDVAVKKLKGDVLHGLKEFISEVEKMASASASLYVVHLIGILQENTLGPPGIVMEYMKHGSLSTLMERVSPIPWALKFRILYQVTLGMNWLHNLDPPLLHLDLKTKNILVNEELSIKISDFGLSKYTNVSTVCGLEDCEGVGGTLQYMPPEAFQEEYKPSTSTDVYSFAILSAVVLRGESPYPVDKSVLIRTHIPRGQRPCLQSLKNEMSVKYLNEAIECTKHCWDNDKLNRPSFSECCTKWEVIYTAHHSEIRKAVRQVQDKMESSASSGKTTDVSYTEDSATINTKDMSEMVHRFQTMNVSEGPPVLLESVPLMNSPNMQSHPVRVRPEMLPPGHPQGAVQSNYRHQSTYYTESPNMQSQHPRVHPQPLPQSHFPAAMRSNYRNQSTYYPDSVPVMNPPNMDSGVYPYTLPQGHSPGAMGSNYRPQPQYYQGVSQFWPQTVPRYQPGISFPPSFPSNTTTINICNSENFQIGDATNMNVTGNSHFGPYGSMFNRQPARTSRSHYFTPMSPQPKQTTQEYYNMPAREASSDQLRKQETVVRKDQQSHIRPVQTTSEGHYSNVCSTQKVTQGSTSTIGEPTTKHPGQ